MALDLSTLTTEQQIAAIYIGYYERAGEPDGANFWEAVLENPAFSLADIASDFAVQQETLDAHPFFQNPTEAEANAFLTSLYGNLFAREADVEGLNFWAPILVGVINGETFDSDGDGVDDITQVGDIILAIIQGAQDVEGGAQDRTAILNKIEVATSWTTAAEADGQTAAFAELGSAVQASAFSIVAGVTAAESTVTAAKGEIDTIFAPEPVEGNTIFLTSATDVTDQPNQITGIAPESTDNNDLFLGYMAQNPFAGGVSNSLSSADRLDGKGGTDRLYAELSQEFVGATSNGVTIDVQPKLTSIEIIELEARDMGNNAGVTIDINTGSISTGATGGGDVIVGGDINDDIDNDQNGDSSIFSTTTVFFGSDSLPDNFFVPVATFDAKDSFGIDFIGSKNSDGDLIIENLNTKENRDDAVGRKTADMTITMDHTDNFNSDGDASDLAVYFDDNYLLANDPIASGALLTIELMDLDAETLGQDPLLDNPFGAITFTFGGELKELNYGTDSNTYAELLADIQAAIDLAAQTDPDFEQLTASFGEPFTVRDTDADPNPARPPLTGTTIVITNSGPEELEAVSMIATGTQPAGKDFHTGFDNDAPQEQNFDIEVNIDLHKVGRGGEGGDLVVGGKYQEENGDDLDGKGINVFNVDVLGAGDDDADGAPTKPSNMGTLTSTNGALHTVNIATHEDFVDGDTFASLTIRDGFNHVGSDEENGDLQLVNANDFFGDLTLGNVERIINLDTLTALGGGDVAFFAVLDGEEVDQDYVYMTGSGDDFIDVLIEGDALDYRDSGLEIKSGAGDDGINVNFDIVNNLNDSIPGGDDTNEQLNQAVLDNVDIDGEEGDDIINVDGVGNANISGGSGNDIIYTDGDPVEGDYAVWAFNFDNERVDDNPFGLGSIDPEDLPGVQNSLAYLEGAVVTVTLSGAGIANAAAGGGVMALPLLGAVQGDDGYEASFTIRDILGSNEYFGTQRDVNNAVIAAIEGDAVLDALLSVEVAANNTLVITSKTSGDFDAEDIRIDITHGRASDASYANAVLAEAKELFGTSDLSLTDLWGTSTFTTPASYQTDADSAGVVFSSSAAANAWYDGLSIRSGDNSADDNLHTQGSASQSETDNVINGGDGDDIIVLSTDASSNDVADYTDDADAIGNNNNAMINGASNETIVMEGDFGDDTVMNFTTADSLVDIPDTQTPIVTDVTVDEAGTDLDVTAGVPEIFTLDVSSVPVAATPYNVEFGSVVATIPANATTLQIAEAIAAAFATANASGFTAVDNLDSTVTFTADAAGIVDPDISIASNFNSTPGFEGAAAIVTDQQGTADVVNDAGTPAVYTLTFADEALDTVTDGSITILGTTYTVADGDLAADIAATVAATPPTGYTAVDNLDGTVTLTATSVGVGPAAGAVVTDNTIDGITDGTALFAPGLDFLDFTSYLTSMEDESPTSGADSNAMIPVTLDDDLLDVQANEVAVVQFTAATGQSFGGLSEVVLETLFNSTDAANNYGNLTVAANADDEYTQTANTDQLIGGAAKSIVMIENAANLGEYKVFELSWNGDASADADSSNDGVVDATLIGSLDFGTSLDGLMEVNLVGSEDYGDLVANGILNYTV